ncbi:hypothetical protein [Aneurinibacillus tyrosinisolvens]|nr:hypothetical protein [Aneurinibacillus tyrosinisolvens]
MARAIVPKVGFTGKNIIGMHYHSGTKTFADMTGNKKMCNCSLRI